MLASICPDIAHAQSVRQSGNVTPGHVATWVAPGVVADGGVPGGPIFSGSTTANDFACAGTNGGAASTIIDCGLSATGTNAWTGLQNFNGGATAPTRSLGDNTTNVATTAFVNRALSCLNITSYGGVGDNSTDNVAALNAAIAALTGTGGCIYFPAGTYSFSAGVTATLANAISSLTIAGSGQDSTILTWPAGAGGITVNYQSAYNGVHFRDITFSTGTTNGGNAIKLNASSSLAGIPATTDLYGVTIRGSDGYQMTDYWTNCINIANVSNVELQNVTCIGSTAQQGTGVTIAGLPGSMAYSTAINISQSSFMGLSTGVVYGSYVQGVTVNQSNFTFVTNGVVSLGSETGALVQLSVTNSQFNPGSVSGGVGLNTQTAIGGLTVTNNFFVIGGPTQFGIVVGSASHCQIAFNQLQGIGSTSGNGIVIGPQAASAPCGVSNNEIFGWGSGGLGLWLQTGSANVVVNHNNFVSNATNINNQGTSNIITDNQGYNPIGVFAPVTMGASPFTYTAGSSPETHYINQSATNTATITKNGHGISTLINSSTYYIIELRPNESYTATWATTAPTYTKDVH